MAVRISELISSLIQWFTSTWRAVRSASKSAPEMAFHLKRGKTGETLAYHCLRKNGYRIVARNYRKYYGEIDLIGWENGVLVFVEVKLRKNSDHGIVSIQGSPGKERIEILKDAFKDPFPA